MECDKIILGKLYVLDLNHIQDWGGRGCSRYLHLSCTAFTVHNMFIQFEIAIILLLSHLDFHRDLYANYVS